MSLNVDGLTFTFDTGCAASKFDDWSFYRGHFSRMWNGIKAVDLVALNANTAWFVEVKDYRRNPRTKTIDLSAEVGVKVFSTLAAILPAKANATDPVESSFAHQLLRTTKVRVVLHLEQPTKHSKLFPRAIDPANVQMKLRSLLKPIDPHPLSPSRAGNPS